MVWKIRKNVVLSYSEIIFSDLPKCKCYSLLSKLAVEIKRSKIFGVNNDAQK